MTPVITTDSKGHYLVVMDQVHLLQKAEVNFVLALEAWFSAFWVFSVEYPKDLFKTLMFCENILGGVSKVPAAVTMWVKRLNRAEVD